MFFILILHSAGISSTSSSLSLLNALATVSFGCELFAVDALSLSEIPAIGFLNEVETMLELSLPRFTDIFGGGGTLSF